MSAVVDLDPVGRAELPDMRPHLRDGYAHLRRRRFFFAKGIKPLHGSLTQPRQLRDVSFALKG
jgi:hypothetical protein